MKRERDNLVVFYYLIRGVKREGDNLVVFYYLSASFGLSDKRGEQLLYIIEFIT